MGECKNYLQNIIYFDNKGYACGSDSGKQTCYSIDQPNTVFHAFALTGVTPNSRFVRNNLEKFSMNKDKMVIISAGSFARGEASLQVTLFDPRNLKMTKIREKSIKGN